MATTSTADKLAKLEKKIAKREKAIADDTKELDIVLIICLIRYKPT